MTCTSVIVAGKSHWLPQLIQEDWIRPEPRAADGEVTAGRFLNKTSLMVAVKDAAVTEGGTVPLPQRPELTGLAAEPSQFRHLLLPEP